MKKTLSIMMLAMMMATGAMAQKVVLNYANGETLKVKVSNLESITFEEEVPIGDLEYVDLGLPSKTLWATCNIGASEPEEVGGHFAWGETETKETYSWTTYQLCDGSNQTMKKYCTNEYYGTVDGRKALEPADDVATALYGDGWSMPTQEQFEELLDRENTSWSRTTQYGVEGLKVTSKANGKTIFLPIGGYRDGTGSYNTSNGYYWTKDLYAGIDNLARSLAIESNSVSTGDSKSRRCGLNVRPVYKEPAKEYVEIGGLKWATMNVGATTVAGDYRTCRGDYFAWGETKPRYSAIEWTSETEATFTWRNKYSSGYSENVMPTYTGEILDAEHDAATANWGDEWRTPTMEEFDALVKACSDSDNPKPVKLINTIDEGGIYFLDETQTIEPAYTGVAGLLFVSKSDINKRVFFPICGSVSNTSVNQGGDVGYYWSSSLYTQDTRAYCTILTSSSIGLSALRQRYYGLTIRPVKK
ncbi:MAG: hypothetical protein J6U33_02090 [Paludibacteraceae bacterium]|nr:hypothetical protein [Paludibacteraceae bacterium]